MTDREAPRLAKWPFLLGDALLLGVASWVALRAGAAPGGWPMLICLGAVALGAWICTVPFLRDHAAALQFAEADKLARAVDQIRHLELVQAKISDATAHWQAIHETAAQAARGAGELAERMAAQTAEFEKFFQRAADQEKVTLRLELEKLRRGEGEFLQTLVRVLDHVFALHQAGVQSGQPELIRELTQFQNACREAARRIGLIVLVPGPAEAFDPRMHEVPDAGPNVPPAGTPIARVLALLGSERAWVVHSADGLDEITTTDTTHVAELKDGRVNLFDVTPEDAGLPRAKLADLKGGTPQDNAAAITNLLSGKPGPFRDIVLMNSAAALMIAGAAPSLKEGVAKAAASIDGGKAKAALAKLVAITNSQPPEAKA